MILAWVNDIFDGVSAFFTGLRQTGHFLVENLRGQGGATAITRQYPEQPAEMIGNRQRGHLYNDAAKCIVCHACDIVCPVDCFKMEGERDANNKIHTSRFDIDLSKCIYCGLCVRACPTDSLSMTSSFELSPRQEGARFLFMRNSSQIDVHFDEADMTRLHQLAQLPREQLGPEDRTWLDARIDPAGQHLIGMYGFGYYSPGDKARVDAEREQKKKAKDAAAAAAKEAAAKAAAAKPPASPAGPPAAGPAAPPATPPAAAPATPPATPPAAPPARGAS
ncbi:MAG TPA: 4Fe-4S binding protein [Planctomycetota bacterium]|nr:4Fe-4S binding protein [Planctomycetota bacterium]